MASKQRDHVGSANYLTNTVPWQFWMQFTSVLCIFSTVADNQWPRKKCYPERMCQTQGSNSELEIASAPGDDAVEASDRISPFPW